MFRTAFSFRKATGSPEAVVKRAKELGYASAPICDFNNTFAWVRWEKACKSNEITPVFGVSLNVTSMIEAKKPTLDQFNFFATDDVKPLNDLIRLAYYQGRSMPRVGFMPLVKYSDLKKFDNLIMVSGYKARLDEMNPEQRNLFVGRSPACAKGFLVSAKEKGFKFTNRHDQCYIDEGDRDFYQVTCGYDNDLRTWKQHMLSGAEIEEELQRNGV